MNLGDGFFVGALLIIAVITVIGNILVILAVFSNRRLQNPANYLMVNLAVSDFFQGAITMPMRGAEVLNTSGEGLVRCDVVISLTILFHSASNFNLALIALDRFIAVSKPFAYATVVKSSSYKIVVALSWLLSLLISGCIVAGWQRHTIPEGVGSICRFGTTLTDGYIIMYVILVDVTPLIIMLVTYTYIFRTTRRQIRQIRDQEIAVNHAAINQAFDSRRPSLTNCEQPTHSIPDAPIPTAWHSETVETSHANPREKPSEGETSNNNNNQTDGGTKKPAARRFSKSQALSTTRTRKATRTVLAIIGFFIILCLPISVIDAIELWCKPCNRIPPAVITVALCMVSFNSCVNVFVYGGYNTDYRKAYWSVWHRAQDVFFNIFSTGKKTTVQSVHSAAQVASIT